MANCEVSGEGRAWMKQRWIEKHTEIICPECGAEYNYEITLMFRGNEESCGLNYCPNCGADMTDDGDMTCADIIKQMPPGHDVEYAIYGGDVKNAIKLLSHQMSIRPCKEFRADEKTFRVIEKTSRAEYIIGRRDSVTIGGVPVVIDDTAPRGELIGIKDVIVYGVKMDLPVVVVECIPVEDEE